MWLCAGDLRCGWMPWPLVCFSCWILIAHITREKNCSHNEPSLPKHCTALLPTVSILDAISVQFQQFPTHRWKGLMSSAENSQNANNSTATGPP